MDNIDKLIEAVEHPENFSDSELKALISDPEAMKLYRLLCASRSVAFVSESSLDSEEIDNQWQRFNNQRRRKTFFFRFYNRKVAAVAAFLIASCSIIVVGVSLNNHIKQNSDNSKHKEITVSDTAPHQETEQSTLPALNDTVIIFEDQKLDMILSKIAPYYNAKVDLKNPKSKEVRLFLKWDSKTSLDDLIEHLNSFDRINLFLNEDAITDY